MPKRATKPVISMLKIAKIEIVESEFKNEQKEKIVGVCILSTTKASIRLLHKFEYFVSCTRRMSE